MLSFSVNGTPSLQYFNFQVTGNTVDITVIPLHVFHQCFDVGCKQREKCFVANAPQFCVVEKYFRPKIFLSAFASIPAQLCNFLAYVHLFKVLLSGLKPSETCSLIKKLFLS